MTRREKVGRAALVAVLLAPGLGGNDGATLVAVAAFLMVAGLIANHCSGK